MNFETFVTKLSEMGISTNFSNVERLKSSATKIPLRYEPSVIEYYRRYFPSGANSKVTDLALPNVNGYWPMAISEIGSINYLSTNGSCVFPPIFSSDLSSKVQAKLARMCFDLLTEISRTSREFEIGELEVHQDHLGSVHIWQECILEEKLDFDFYLDNVLDLRNPYSQIINNFSDSTRYDIRKGSEKFIYRIPSIEEISTDFDRYRALHLEVAGRITRSPITWEMQKSRLQQDEALLILAEDVDNGNLISGSYFEFNGYEAIYASSATNRSYFNTSVNHGMQALAIESFVDRGILYYLLGEQFSPAKTDEKNQNIPKFKARFASHRESRIKVKLPNEVAVPRK